MGTGSRIQKKSSWQISCERAAPEVAAPEIAQRCSEGAQHPRGRGTPEPQNPRGRVEAQQVGALPQRSYEDLYEDLRNVCQRPLG